MRLAKIISILVFTVACCTLFSCSDQSTSTAGGGGSSGGSLTVAGTYFVGPNGNDSTGKGTKAKPWKSVKKAYAKAAPGDTVTILPGTYTGKDARLLIKGTNNVTFLGVIDKSLQKNGERPTRPHMKLKPGEKAQSGKAVWVDAANNITIKNIEFSGAKVRDSNGAGIRVGTIQKVTINNCYFHDNQDGILSSNNSDGNITIENSEFGRNGDGSGFTHNVYVGRVNKLTFRYNYVHDVKNGNLVKTRARTSYIEYNRISFGNDPDYVANYNVDIPDGGVAYVIGNLIEQAAYLNRNKQNNNILEYGTEHPNQYAKKALYIVNNTFVNNATPENARGGAFILLLHHQSSLKVVNRNNIFAGPGQVEKGEAKFNSNHNYHGDHPGFVNAANHNYHLISPSPAVDGGGDPGSGNNGYDLRPKEEYINIANAKNRPIEGDTIDIGAFEYGTFN